MHPDMFWNCGLHPPCPGHAALPNNRVQQTQGKSQGEGLWGQGRPFEAGTAYPRRPVGRSFPASEKPWLKSMLLVRLSWDFNISFHR